ncbi:aldo-keto reductase [Pseudohyphozyma bogoriensis]|nr:aldo-keto reductase [Pseudohyphozyma bogoriensis]
MAPLNINSTVTLLSGAKLPVLGFGVFQSTAALASTTAALKAGYSHIDSARYYRNESEVAKAVKEFKENGGGDVWITTKVMSSEHGTAITDRAVEDSVGIASAQGQVWDLVLLHDPTSGPKKRLEAWKVLEQKKKEGKIKAIGVSNFSEKHLQQFKDAGVSTPDVNQIEIHPWLAQQPIVDYCKKEGIIIQAYCPLVRGDRFDDPTLVEVAESVSKTPAQVLIRWSLQKGYVPLPKSDTPSRIVANADVFDFELDASAMAKLDALDKGPAGACSWNPVNVA